MNGSGKGSGILGGNPAIWGPPAAVAVGIFILSSLKGNAFPDHPEILNIAAHGVEFMVLAFVTTRAFIQSDLTTRPLQSLVWVAAVCAAFGLLDELHQFSIPTRQFDTLDILADTIGAIVGSLLYLLLRERKAKGQSRETA
ncbi:MAG: VanZ family protein [bacterium]|nr:MAG: VanZ family protein [bacterium]